MADQTRHLVRDVTRTECPWLAKDLAKGHRLADFWGATYGCVSPSGKAMKEPGTDGPFFEIPRDALSEVEPTHD